MRINLILKRAPFDQIKAGTKKKEFRDVNDYYLQRFCTIDKYGEITSFKPIKEILFFNGYRKDRPEMIVECLGISVEKIQFEGENRPYDTFVLKIGKVLSVKNC
jgi:hypothetical protein